MCHSHVLNVCFSLWTFHIETAMKREVSYIITVFVEAGISTEPGLCLKVHEDPPPKNVIQ